MGGEGTEPKRTTTLPRPYVITRFRPAGHTGHTCTPSAIINGTVTQPRKVRACSAFELRMRG